MDDQYHMLPETSPSRDQLESEPPPVPRAAQPSTSDRSILHPYPPGVVEEDPSGTTLLVPRNLVVSSRYRSMLPFPPASHLVRRALQVIGREGYSALPARWIDGNFEVLGHEVLLDALHSSGVESIRIRLVTPADEVNAFVLGRRTRDVHTPHPSAFELLREVWVVWKLEGCTTWTEVGDIMGYHKSTVQHAKRDGDLITPEVVKRAGIDETDPKQIQRLRRVTGKRLRWVGEGASPDDRAIRLALVFSGDVPAWASPEQIEVNREKTSSSSVRERRSRDGKVIALAELSITDASKEELKKSLRNYQKLVWRMFDELNANDSEQNESPED